MARLSASVISHLYLTKQLTNISCILSQGFSKVTFAEINSLLYQFTDTATQPAALADPAHFDSLAAGFVSPTAATKNGKRTILLYFYGNAALAGMTYDAALHQAFLARPRHDDGAANSHRGGI
ncbi:hypothetical protein NpNSSI1_00006438 [Neofusicoccum parvum]|nr:hypothetical protein NpNSSI1_00006438 [Neofusicoccum parvum]